MTQRKYILQIHQDDPFESPREWDNLGTMACWHGDYQLGDEQPSGDPIDYIEDLVDQADPGFADALEEEAEEFFEGRYGEQKVLEEWDEYRDQKVQKAFEQHFISLPLYLYDHSGITMSTGPFSCPWDSGQVGFIYVSRKDAERELYPASTYPRGFVIGPSTVHQWSSLDVHVMHILRSEVEVYDQYLRGDVYGFVLVDEDGEEVDSCWGFYGHDWRENGITDHVDEAEIKKVQWMQPSMVTRMEVFEEEEL